MSDALEKEIWGAEQQGTPTPRTDALIADLCIPYVDGAGEDLSSEVVGEHWRKAWQKAVDEVRQAERELSAARSEANLRNDEVSGLLGMNQELGAEVERLREALEAFMRLRTDAPGFAVAFTAACLGADKALAAAKEEGNG